MDAPVTMVEARFRRQRHSRRIATLSGGAALLLCLVVAGRVSEGLSLGLARRDPAHRRLL